MQPSRLRHVSAAALLVLLAACSGSDGASDPTTTSSSAPTSTPSTASTTTTSTTTSMPSTTEASTTVLPGTTQPLTPQERKAALSFAPVLATVACPTEEPTPSTTTGPNGPETTIPAPGPDPAPTPSADDATCYQLGPTRADGNDLGGAEVQGDGSAENGWMVSVKPAPASVESLNSLFNECYEGAPTCPGMSFDGRGSLAIVLDGTVVSAPAINGPDLASDAFVISGTFAEVEARALAALLNS